MESAKSSCGESRKSRGFTEERGHSIILPHEMYSLQVTAEGGEHFRYKFPCRGFWRGLRHRDILGFS